jgi:uncharacterized membrane protein SpoIIM required for sporulation
MKMNVNIKEYCIDYFNRMKYYVLLSSVIFVAFLLLSYFYPSFFNTLMNQALQNMRDGVTNGEILLETTSLFINNFTVALNIYTSGIYLSIPSLYLLVYNAAMIGYTGTTLPLNYFLAYTVPHGIFELTAIVLSGAASFRLTHGILNVFAGLKPDADDKKKYFLENLEVSLKMILDSAALMLIVLILLIVAAFIEANITVGIGQILTMR